jgi:Ca2+-binding RTX toxin-like protein
LSIDSSLGVLGQRYDVNGQAVDNDFTLLGGVIDLASGDLVISFSDGNADVNTVTVRDHAFDPLENIRYIEGGVEVIKAITSETLDASGQSDSIIFASIRDDDILGSSGDDVIYANLGKDLVDGNDVIDGAGGSDVAMFVGNQSDYTFASSVDGLTVTVTETNTGEGDVLTNVETMRFADGDITVSADGNGLVLTGSSGADRITIVGDVPVTVLGGGEADVIVGDLGGDILAGEDGADVITGGGGADTIDGGAGDDTITGAEGDDTIDGGEGDDVAVYAGNQSDYTFESSAHGNVNGLR